MNVKIIKLPIIVFAVILMFTCLFGNHVNIAKAAAITFNDASSWALPELEKAEAFGLITDKVKLKFNASITREEFAEIAVRLYEKATGKVAVYTEVTVFSDTKNLEIFKAYNLAIVNGTNLEKKLFSPDILTNREEVATMLFRAIKAIAPDADLPISGAPVFNDQGNIAEWALDAVKYMSKNAFLKGTGTGAFEPKRACSREEAVVIALRVYENFIQDGMDNQGTDNDETADTDSFEWDQIVINDYVLSTDKFITKEKDGYDYIFLSKDNFKYSFKYPYLGNYTYPEVTVDNNNIKIIWRDESDILIQAELNTDSTMVVINGNEIDGGIEPFELNGEVFIPTNIFIAVLDMEAEVSSDLNSLIIQYNEDFPSDIIVGKWSDVSTDLFTGIKDIISGSFVISTSANSYMFNEDATFARIMISPDTTNSTFILQTGSYQIMGNTIMFYNIIETLYKGSPFKLVHENKALENPEYDFISNYSISNVESFEIGGMWLDRK